MNRRWLGVIGSIALAVVGAFLLVRYVQGADERALEGEETVEVLVLSAPVQRGTASEDLEGRVETVLVPAKLQTPGSVGDLSALEGMFATVDLVPGEQLLVSRFASADSLDALTEFPLPDGLLEVTLSLSPERALGGVLRPGEVVAVIASFVPLNVSEEVVVESTPSPVTTGDEEGTLPTPIFAPETEVVTDRTPHSTHLIIHTALVTNVQQERLPTSSDAETAEESGIELAPTGKLLVSLALGQEDAERTVFTAEFGNVWLARTSETASSDPTPIQTRATVYGPEGRIDQASVK